MSGRDDVLLLGGVVEISTVDYPGKVVSVIFLCGCPFRCPYCQNWRLFREEDCRAVEVDKVLSFIEENSVLIDGVCITGGEPLQQIGPLIKLVRGIKDLGLLVKVDTNGFYPSRLKLLMDTSCIDYFAIDIKARLDPQSYGRAIGIPIIGERAIKNLMESLRVIHDHGAFLEGRTTVVPGIVDSPADIENIASTVAEYVDIYVLQQFRTEGGTLDPSYSKITPPSREKLLDLARVAKKYIQDVRVRTKEGGEERI
ncbi:MAG: anaerobic ribonucleoside-triphosphate reductase activating protein [Candidatus Baldrarchaeia archaeon]